MTGRSDWGLDMPIPGAELAPPAGHAPLAPSTDAARATSLGTSRAMMLRCIAGGRIGEIYHLPENGGMVGRRDAREVVEPDCDLTGQEPEHSEHSVSRRHAEISRRGQTWVVIDLDSVNGTRLNGHRLGAGEPHPIRKGDVVSFGRISLVLMDGGKP